MAYSNRTKWSRLILLVICITLGWYCYRNATADRDYYTWRSTSSSSNVQTGGFDWSKRPVLHPVASLHALPTGAPAKLPKVQFDFPPESGSDRKVRESRRDAVRDAFLRCWKSYQKNAWMADELAPISGGVKNHFGGWAATLVDALDTLWIMDLKEEFDEAVTAAVAIDFSGTSMDEINLFETTIRYLGGFIAAYDLSGDGRLLTKATELGEMLLAAFDTPNRMPVTRWRVSEAQQGREQVAHPVSLLAEIGSLTMEFTRLSQITGDARWYDATHRVMKALEEQQGRTKIPGMWPVLVDAQKADFTQHSIFTLGAMSDSLYEYLPKMHALLGGLEPMYEKLYHDALNAALKHTIFRPMTPDEADILIAGAAHVNQDLSKGLDAVGQHLVCFAGGMYAFGGKLFKDAKHVDVGRQLTDGCIWTYRALPLGIMPEVFSMTACPGKEICAWEQAAWEEAVVKSKGPMAGQSGAGSAAGLIIELDRLPQGFTAINDRRYMLRPEAIESVWILYRITGRKDLSETAWDMFNAIMENTRTELANGAIPDVTRKDGKVSVMNSMESFWLAETLKYFYLVFSEADVISLDDYVLNTEAHPFRRPK